MFRVEPLDPNFLSKRADRFVCRVPPFEFSFIEMHDMKYPKPVDTYLTLHYDYKCQIIAHGTYMYHDMFKGTKTRVFHVVKLLDKNFYFLMTEEEQDRYIAKIKKPQFLAEICEN